jgi:hypothetical protein
MRKLIKSPYVISLIEHEAFQKETFFKETTFDFCFYRRPAFDLNMVMQIKKERNTGLTLNELETLLKHQVDYIKRDQTETNP